MALGGWLSSALHSIAGASSALTTQCTSVDVDEPSRAHLPSHAVAPSGPGIHFGTGRDGSMRAISFCTGGERVGVSTVHDSISGFPFRFLSAERRNVKKV